MAARAAALGERGAATAAAARLAARAAAARAAAVMVVVARTAGVVEMGSRHPTTYRRSTR